jgi:hypothetical protein
MKLHYELEVDDEQATTDKECARTLLRLSMSAVRLALAAPFVLLLLLYVQSLSTSIYSSLNARAIRSTSSTGIGTTVARPAKQLHLPNLSAKKSAMPE